MNNKELILGVFDDPEVVTKAVDKLVKNNIKVNEVYSPFPLEHVWKKLKMKSRIPYLTFLYGAFGTTATFAFVYWTSVIDYPLTFGGKPHNTLSFVVLMFVLTILSGVIFTLLTLLGREKMWPGKKGFMPDNRSMDDKFVIVINKGKDMDDDSVKKIDELLKNSGAVEVNISQV